MKQGAWIAVGVALVLAIVVAAFAVSRMMHVAERADVIESKDSTSPILRELSDE